MTITARKDTDRAVGGEEAFGPSATLSINICPILDSVAGKLTDDDVDQWMVELSQANEGRGFYLELSNKGELVINPMVYADSGFAEAEGIADLLFWAREHGGRVPSSRTIVRLPDGARAEPDFSWLSPAQVEELAALGFNRAIPFCPVFVAEVVSGSDRLAALHRKMERYLANGAQLAWLIDPYRRRVYIYRPGAEPEELEDPETVSGEGIMPGFIFDVRRRIFDLHTTVE